METDKSKVVSIMSFNSVMEAQLYKALLESAGVAARMQNDIAAQVVPAYGALMQINLLVAEADQHRAREILGAKFDIDEFNRQSNLPRRETDRKPAGKTTTKKPAAKKVATGKSVSKDAAGKAAAVKRTVKKTDASRGGEKPPKSTPVSGCGPGTDKAKPSPSSRENPARKKPAEK